MLRVLSTAFTELIQRQLPLVFCLRICLILSSYIIPAITNRTNQSVFLPGSFLSHNIWNYEAGIRNNALSQYEK